MLEYEGIDPAVARSAMWAFDRHLWYLTAEMVPLSLFSSAVPEEDKQALTDRLLVVRPKEGLKKQCGRYGTKFGKPDFCKIPESMKQSTTLADLVKPESWFTFELLQIDHSFLTDVESWPDSAAYQRSLSNIQGLNVINDCAERGVKLSSGFLEAAKSEEHYQNILQVVEKDRKNMPNLRKRKLEQKSDH